MKYLAGVVSLRYEVERCAGCGRCTQVCPRGVFRLDAGKARIQDRDLCIECGACMANCAAGALRVEAGVGCAEALLRGLRTGASPECGCCGGASC